MASLRKAKKQAKKEGRIFIDPTKERKQLIRSVKENVLETNRRLRRLDRKGFYNSFSSKKLFDRLDSGKIHTLQKVNGKVIGVTTDFKRLNMTDLTAIQRATDKFLKSATSTVSKTQRVIKQTKDSMFKTLKIKDDSLTMEDIETYYEMLGNNDFDYFNEKLGASEMWGLIDDAVDMDLKRKDKDKFLSMLNRYIDVSDKDVRKRALNLFDKYVIGG